MGRVGSARCTDQTPQRGVPGMMNKGKRSDRFRSDLFSKGFAGKYFGMPAYLA
jgi:hypothetical protein